MLTWFGVAIAFIAALALTPVAIRPVSYTHLEKVPPIVSEELWEKAAQIRTRRSKKYGKSAANNRYPYSSKIICQQHQVPFYRSVYKYRQGEREVWQCREYAQRGRAGCLAPVIYTDELDQIMRQCLRSVLLPPEQIICHLLAIYRQISEQSQAKSVMNSLAAELEKLRQRKDRLLDLNICGHISDEEDVYKRQNLAYAEIVYTIDGQQMEPSRLEFKDLPIVYHQAPGDDYTLHICYYDADGNSYE